MSMCTYLHTYEAGQSSYTQRQLFFHMEKSELYLRQDLNRQHTAQRADALPTELPRQLSWAGWIQIPGQNMYWHLRTVLINNSDNRCVGEQSDPGFSGSDVDNEALVSFVEVIVNDCDVDTRSSLSLREYQLLCEGGVVIRSWGGGGSGGGGGGG